MRSTVRPVLAALAVTAALGCFPQEVSAADPAKSAVGAGGPAPADAAATGAAAASTGAVPRPDHVVVVVMENRSLSEIDGNPEAPFINAFAAGGALFTQSYAIRHPSEPNYLALFSGSTQGLTDDSCPHTYSTANLGRALLNAHRTFAGYSEGLPFPGSSTCRSGAYVRKHNPWVNFPSVPASVNLPFTSFPRDFTKLPNLSFVVPDLNHDMHDGTVAAGDLWLRNNLGGYISWAATHNSLLVLTWDEDDRSQSNRILTVVGGAHVRPGRYAERIDHYRLLRTLEALEGSAAVGQSISATPVTSIWTP